MITLRYEYLRTNENNKKIYAVISSDGNSYSSCSEDNEEFKKWIAEGGEVIDNPPTE